jgi:hypothetical protein
MRRRVYKFIRSQYGISSLEKKRLKVSTIEDLNDPFDFLAAIETTDPRVAHAVSMLGDQFKGKIGLLCFSRNWDNLLLWSHYGASHTGICLGFDISEGDPGANFDIDVLYQPNLLQIHSPKDVNFDLANRLLRTKHESWSYEQEVRMFVNLSDPPDAEGLNWIEFGPLLVLREIIIGAQCHPAVSKKVQEAAKPLGDAVKCWWAGMRPDAFLLVKQADPPHWHAKVR